MQRARGPVSAYYLLASVDLVRDTQGRIERVPEANRIYVDVLLRTVGISATVTVLCLVLGFPVALLLTQVRDRTADWLMALVLLPVLDVAARPYSRVGSAVAARGHRQRRSHEARVDRRAANAHL